MSRNGSRSSKQAKPNTRRGRDERLQREASLAYTNKQAMDEGPQRKHWSPHDIRAIRPITDHQRDLFVQYGQGDNVLAIGSAGTGKTFLSLYLALQDVLNPINTLKQVIIVRSAVSTRDLGFLPGSEAEKISVYETPYRDIVNDLVGYNAAYDQMKDAGIIKFMPTSFVRGLTWDDAIIIIDECQNLTFHEIHSVITRAGDGSRIIFAGDIGQNDLITKKNDQSGFTQFINIARSMKEFSEVMFTSDDIVRSAFVKSWIMACERNGITSVA
jgi:phosphate starvation-inducible protein PhoH